MTPLAKTPITKTTTDAPLNCFLNQSKNRPCAQISSWHLNIQVWHVCTVPKYRAAVDYTLSGVEPHGSTRGVWPMATVAKHSQSYLVTSNI